MIQPYITNNINSFTIQYAEAKPFPYSFFIPFLDHPMLKLVEHEQYNNIQQTTNFVIKYLKSQTVTNLIQQITNTKNLTTEQNNNQPTISLSLFYNSQQQFNINLISNNKLQPNIILKPTFNSCLILNNKNINNCQIVDQNNQNNQNNLINIVYYQNS
jgi:hypothetical protein